MDGWDGWFRPQLPTPPQKKAEEYREVVWDRGMPQESRERITPDDPRWPTAEKI